MAVTKLVTSDDGQDFEALMHKFASSDSVQRQATSGNGETPDKNRRAQGHLREVASADANDQDIEWMFLDAAGKDSAPRPTTGINSEMTNRNRPAQIPRRGSAAIQEIDRLIEVLNALRDFLQRESQRVQLAVDQYAETSQSSIESLKQIAEVLESWCRARQR
jgi:hypothetical protein